VSAKKGKPWNALPPETRERLLWLRASLHEFHEGFLVVSAYMKENDNPINPAVRFCRNSVFIYPHAYYCTRGTLTFQILEEIGRGDIAEAIRRRLATKAGDVTVGQIISNTRNKGVEHQLFTRAGFRQTMRGDSTVGAKVFGRLIRRTNILHVRLRQMYPEAAKALDEACLRSVDN
jgi:hypothetical protein